jgi:hypothetical protein
MNTPRRSYRMPETELARLREIQERFPDQTKALLFCINHTWATTTADGAADLVWETVANREPQPSDYRFSNGESMAEILAAQTPEYRQALTENIKVIIDAVDDDRHCSILDNSTERPPQ